MRGTWLRWGLFVGWAAVVLVAFGTTTIFPDQKEVPRILVREIEEALCSRRTKIIADYPTDPRGVSFLMLGFSSARRPIHAVCAITDLLLIITLYRPDLGRWIEWRERREG